MRNWHLVLLLLLLLLLQTTDARIRRHHRKRRFSKYDYGWNSTTSSEPYCGETANAQTQFDEMRESGNGTNEILSKIFSTHFNLALDSTICIKLQNIVHVLKYERLEQHYPIENSYPFAIPLIDTTCKCHCTDMGANGVCNVEKYADDRNCTASSEFPTCYTKFHNAVAPIDCVVTTIPAKACCDVKLKPFDGKVYRAVKLGQPISDMIISYSIYSNATGRMTKILGPDENRIILNKGKEQFELNEHHRISVSLTAPPPHQQLREGMYYFPEENHDDLREGKINEISEGDLDKIGWYRKQGNEWQVASNGLLLRNAHKVIIKNCKEQVHLDQFSGAKHYILRGTKYNDTLNEKRVADNNYVRRVRVDLTNRVATIFHEHGTTASVFLKTDSRPNLTKSQSILANFTGSITLDHDGNRMLNVTFYGVKGTVHIKLFENDRKTVATFACTAQFGTSIKDDGSKINLPATITQAQFVCILPDEQPAKNEICKWIPYEEKAMRVPREEQSWSKGHSPCSSTECNAMSRGPTEWFPWLVNFDYLQSHNLDFGEYAKIGVHLVTIAVVTLLFVMILTKCLIPLICCSLSVPFSKKKKGKS